MHFTFTEKDLSGGNYIPEGDHEVTVTEIKESPSKAGNPQFVVTLKDRYGREAKEYLPQAENLRWKVSNFALAAGFTREQLRAGGLNVSALMGRKLLIAKKQSGVKMVDGLEKKQYSQELFPLTTQPSTPSTGTEQTDDIPF